MRNLNDSQDLEAARAQLRASLRTTRWLRRLAVLLGLIIAMLILSIRLQG